MVNLGWKGSFRDICAWHSLGVPLRAIAVNGSLMLISSKQSTPALILLGSGSSSVPSFPIRAAATLEKTAALDWASFSAISPSVCLSLCLRKRRTANLALFACLADSTYIHALTQQFCAKLMLACRGHRLLTTLRACQDHMMVESCTAMIAKVSFHAGYKTASENCSCPGAALHSVPYLIFTGQNRPNALLVDMHEAVHLQKAGESELYPL